MSADNFTTCLYPDNSGFADTHGWDTVYAVRFPIINEALKKHFDPKGDLADALIIEHDDRYVSIKGKFGAWRLTTGGSGNRIFLEMPFTEGEVTFKLFGVTVKLADLVAKVEVLLGFHTAPDDPGKGLLADLKIVVGGPAVTSASQDTLGKNASASGKASDFDVGVSVRDIRGLEATGLAKEDAAFASMFLGSALKTWLEKNPEIFDFVFLSVDIAEQEDVGDFKWIKPTRVGYAVADILDADQKTSAKDSIFAVLAMTEGRNPAGATAAVSVDSIPSNAGVNSAFLISPRLFVEKFIMPYIAGMFTGDLKSTDFGLNREGTKITNLVDLHIPLELEQHYYDQLRSVEIGTIKAGNFSIEVDKHMLKTSFESLTFPFGRDDVLSVELVMRHANILGVDDAKKFALKTSGEIIRHLNVVPDPKKVTGEGWKSFAINMGVTLAIAVIPWGRVVGKVAGGAKSLFRGATVIEGEGAQVLAKEATTVTERELVQVAESGMGRALQSGEAAALRGEFQATGKVLTAGELSAETGLKGEVAAGQGAAKGVPVGEVPSRFDRTFLAFMGGQLIGGLYGQGTNLASLGAYQQDGAKIPSLVNFGSNCIRHTTWPGASESKLVCAGLNGAFVLGLEARSAGSDT
ncbi:TULIP family P47-like protein [Starkeya koreensis]|uniref:TULIP family P47-like protein n=1 Tax=Ancylobacter koreensis TaxID=266121 RepID=A0ABT0DNE3_9HYPH|nr:TULIP family P47-like protein [Ancylobacter koreensis]MCK0208667.1 TULIP family P47-like protein [Ancylobacter koreensis]